MVPHCKKALGSNQPSGAFFVWSFHVLCGFSLGAPVSSHSPKTCMLGHLVIQNWPVGVTDRLATCPVCFTSPSMTAGLGSGSVTSLNRIGRSKWIDGYSILAVVANCVVHLMSQNGN